MKQEFKIFLTALMFYSRIPVPALTGYSDENLNKATRYFPLVGIITGSVGAIFFAGINRFLPLNISLLLSLTAMIITTGAFHEDAFADFCDGFGGGVSRDDVLRIMKDSRIGTFGALGLVLNLMIKFFLLASFAPAFIPFILIAANAVSRFNPVLFIFTASYVRDDNSGKSKPLGRKSGAGTFIVALLFAYLPVFILPCNLILATILPVQLMVFIIFRQYVMNRIGGYTGDVLGALQQLSEIIFYINLLVVGNLL